MFNPTPSPRPGDAIAWGDTDPKTKLLSLFTERGLWFTIDTKDPGACYFIGGDKGPVKIGFSTDVEKRLKDIQPHCPFPLRVLATTHGGRSKEAHYHWKFRRLRIHCEWFRRTPGLQNEINRLNAICPYTPWIEAGPGETARVNLAPDSSIHQGQDI